MVVVVAETARATDELAKHDVAEGVAPPATRVAPTDLLCLIPALLLDAVGEAPPGVGVRAWDWVAVVDVEVIEGG